MEIKVFKYLLIVIAIILIISLYFNYSFSNVNKNLNNNLNQLNTTYNNLVLEHNLLQNNFNSLTNKMRLLEKSLKDVTPPNKGARSGILSASDSGWLICFDSLADTNAGDKDSECCDSISGTWHEEICCARDKDNSNWIGETGRCSENGEWTSK